MIYNNREEWLTAAAEYWKHEYPGLPAYRVSCGFPSAGGTAVKKRVIGQCWLPEASADGHAEIFISPVLDDPIEALATLRHELIHAMLPKGAGHGPKFAKAMKALGLEGKPTADHAGKELRFNLEVFTSYLGAYPHAKINFLEKQRTQGTRLLKVLCPECEYTVRITKKWIDVGMPTCPCGTEMELEEEDSE